MNGEDSIARLPLKGARAASLAVLAFLFGAFSSLYAGFSKSDKIDSSSLGKTLADNTVYVVSGNTTIERPSDSANSALYVANGATAVIYIPKNVTLTVKGGDANGTQGAGAGIEVPSSATLIVTGGGSIVASGGNAANGADGRSGDSGYLIDDNDNPMDEWGHAGAGGNGGAGGGGAGAGIGGRGGTGGSGGAGGSWTWYDTDDNFDHNGSDGSAGGKGGDSYSGAIYILGSIFANATGGSAGSAGGSAGSTGSVDVEHFSIFGLSYRACGGGGGGGGGAGDWAYDYGRGGYGGGGGGGGGGGATYQVVQGRDDDNSRGGCGGGGSGYVNGGGSQEDGVSHWGVTGGNGGDGASHGSDSPNTWTYRGPGTSVAGNGYFSTAYTHYSIEYTLTFSDEWRTNEIHEVKLGYAMPAAPVLPERERYVFKGWYLGDTCYYDESGASLRTEYDHIGNLTLTAKWQLEDGTAALTVNGAGIIPGASSSGEGWNYDSASGILTLSASSAYSISGSSLDGEIVIRAAPPSTGFCILTLDGVSIDSGNRSGVAAFTLAEHSYVIVNTSSHSSFSSAAGFPGIMLESDARIVLAGQGALVATGGKGAHDIGFASGITDYGKIFIAASAVDFHPGAGRLPGVVGGNGGIYLFQTGDPPRLWAVSVPGFEPGAAVVWSGLASAYSSEYSTADENGKAWLWLPDGTYNFKSTSGGVEKLWDARVNGEHREAREHVETGLLVDGEDIACLARPGWYWNERYTLCITNGTPFTVSGATTKIGINVKANGNLTISDLNIKLVSDDDHRYAAAIAVDSGRSLRLTLDGESRLNGALYAAAVSVPARASLTIDGTGRLYATGGGRSAGIGTGLSTVCGAIKIESGWIDARGGTYSPGIGIGDSSGSIDYKGGSLEIAGGTVTAGTTREPRSSMNIGSSDDAVFDSVKFTGGSIYPVDNKVGPAPTNAAGEQVYRVTIPGQTPNSAVMDIEIPTAPDYGTENIIADADGKIYLWMPAGAHYFRIGGVIYVVDVNSAPAVARVWESGLYIDGEPLVELGCKGWRYDFAKEAVVFTNSQTFVVSGSTTNEVLSAGVDCVLIASNLTVDATYDTGKAPFSAAAGKTLTIAGGTMSALGGADGLTGGKVLIKGGSLHTGFEAFGRRPVNVADEAVYMVTVEGFDPGARIVSITRESEYVKDVHDYATEAMFADGDGKIYIWLSSGRYDFMVGVEKGGSVEAVEYIAWVNDADATAVEYHDTGLLVDGRDAAHGAGPGWHSDVTNQVSLAEARTFCVSGETEVMGVLAAEDLTVVVSNLVINGTRVAETAPFTVAEGRNVRLETVETNKFYATVPSAAVYVQKNATVTLDGEGVLYAYGGEGGDKASAAIGSGFRQGCGKVVIAGGEVHAISRANTTPAIGVGETYDLALKLGGEFAITGGLVYVAGGKYTADIGPSQHSDCGDIAITGGTVLKETFETVESPVVIGKSTLTESGKIIIGGGSVTANLSTVSPAATNTYGQAVYPVTVEGLAPLVRYRVRGQIEYGDKDVFADREGKLHLWFPKGWNYFLVGGEPYRANIVYDWAEAAQWMSGVYVDGIDAAYVTYGAWKLVDKFIDLTNAVSYVVSGGTQEMSLRASANLTAIVSNLTVNVSGVSGAPAFVVSGVNASMVLKDTNAFSSGYGSAGVAVPSGATLTVSGGGALSATGGEGGAGMGSGNGGGLGQLNITGGSIKATGGEHAAGIGAGDAPSAGFDAGGTVRISGGRVTAVCGADAAPVGSSRNAHPGTVWIDGGTVHADAQGAEGVIGSTPASGAVGSVVIRGGAVYVATNTVPPVYKNHQAAHVFPLQLDIGEVESKVTGLDIGLVGMQYYSQNLKDVYTDENGLLRIWLPSTGGKVLTVAVAMESGVVYRFCIKIDDGGEIVQVEFVAVNDDFVTNDADGEGATWNYKKDTGILTITGDSDVTGIATNGYFRIVVPDGGASRLTLNKLVLTAKNAKSSPAMSLANDVEVFFVRGSEIKSTGSYSAGIEVATDASVSFSALNENATLIAWGGKAGAGIGSSGLNFAVPGRIQILSGTIVAHGGDDAAGIGGGLNGNLARDGIVMSGGFVCAHGGANAAGVGAGKAAVKIPDGAVRVEAGTLLAWGGDDPRQTGGMGGSKSQSDLILSLNNTCDVTGYTYKPFVVTGGSVVPEMTTIDKVAPRPADDSGRALYSVTVTNLAANASVSVSCDDFAGGFDATDIYADDAGRIVLWLAPTNHARRLVVDGAAYETPYPYTNSNDRVLYLQDVVATPAAADSSGAGGPGAVVSAMSMGGNSLSLTLSGPAASRLLSTGASATRRLLSATVSADGALPKIYASPALPFPDPPQEVDFADCEVTDNGDGTVTVSIPLYGSERQMFYMVR